MSQPAHLPLPGCPDLQGDDAPVVLRGATLASRSSVPLGQILLEDGAVTPSDLMKANLIRERQDANLGQILLAQAMVTPAAMARALARQWRTTAIDPHQTPPDPRLIDMCGAGFCLTHGILPWRRIGGVTWIATARPERFEALLPHLPPRFGHVRMLVCSEDQVQDGILGSCRLRLIREAETRVPAAESCRTQDHARTSFLACAALIMLVLGIVLAPVWIVGLLTLWASATLISQSGLKLLTFVAARRALAEQADVPPVQDNRQPLRSRSLCP